MVTGEPATSGADSPVDAVAAPGIGASDGSEVGTELTRAQGGTGRSGAAGAAAGRWGSPGEGIGPLNPGGGSVPGPGIRRGNPPLSGRSAASPGASLPSGTAAAAGPVASPTSAPAPRSPDRPMIDGAPPGGTWRVGRPAGPRGGWPFDSAAPAGAGTAGGWAAGAGTAGAETAGSGAAEAATAEAGAVTAGPAEAGAEAGETGRGGTGRDGATPDCSPRAESPTGAGEAVAVLPDCVFVPGESGRLPRTGRRKSPRADWATNQAGRYPSIGRPGLTASHHSMLGQVAASSR